MAKILIIDDEPSVCEILTRLFEEEGHTVTCIASLAEGAQSAQERPFDVVFLDVIFPSGNGLDALPQIKRAPSAPEVIVITGAGDPSGAEIAMRGGAWDYIEKAASSQVVVLALRRALQYRQGKARQEAPVALKTDNIVGYSPVIRACFDLVARASSSDANVLITGETGTGKELFARAIHENSGRAANRFVVVDCASLPETLVPGMLFGHAKGAFTSANRARSGLVKHADGGTLFLDEVGELPLSEQGTFLRLLQERRYYPVGSTDEVTCDFRLIAATNRNLQKMVEEGRFREDLFYRLRSLALKLPPLRERGTDVQAIAFQHIRTVCAQRQVEAKGISTEFLGDLITYEWPGNVRQLLHALDRAISAAEGAPVLFPSHLPTEIRRKLARESLRKDDPVLLDAPPGIDGEDADSEALPTLRAFRKAAEEQYLQKLMTLCAGNMQRACAISGMSRPRLYALLREHQMPPRP